MAKLLPEERQRTVYEWVVETVDDAGDIIDCSFWGETEVENVLRDRAGVLADRADHNVDLALVRRVGTDADGESDRGYAYFKNGQWAEAFDNGESIPARFAPVLERIAKELGQ